MIAKTRPVFQWQKLLFALQDGKFKKKKAVREDILGMVTSLNVLERP